MPTALYALIEDVVAVDGGGGQMYRYALRTRYLSSPYFRRMLFEMNCFWSGGSIIFAAAITAIIFTVSEPVAFTLGWTLPFAWAGVWTLITIPWVQSDLRREKQAWAENRGQGGIPYVDDIAAPTARTRFASIQDAFVPWARGKEAPPFAPSAEGALGMPSKPESMPDSTPAASEGNSYDLSSVTPQGGEETNPHTEETQEVAATEPTNTSSVEEKK